MPARVVDGYLFSSGFRLEVLPCFDYNCVMTKPSEKNPFGIRKQVGSGVEETPLQRAFRMRQMLIELRGEREDPGHAHIRKLVGRTDQSED